MLRSRSAILISCLLAGFVISAPQSRAADDFYKGKTVNIVVGFTPGGGYDAYGRLLSRHLAKYLAGNPTIIVQNMPSAGSLTAVRYLDATAARDGTVMTIFNPGLVTQSITTPDKVKINFQDYNWIGTATPDYRVCYGFGPNGIKSWDELMKRTKDKPFILGSTAKGSGNYINGATLREVFHANVKQILGFPGSAEQRLAIERGELDGDCGSWSSIPEDWINNHKISPFVRFSPGQTGGIPDSAVFINNFAKTQEQKDLLDVLNAADQIGRPFIMSKQVPADRVKTMRTAFMAAMKDPDLLAEAKKQKLPVDPHTGEEVEKLVAKMSKASPAVVQKAKAIYEE